MKLLRRRARGGHLVHLLEFNGKVIRLKALCGFQPSARVTRGRQMDERHGWWSGEPHESYRPCPGCEERR